MAKCVDRKRFKNRGNQPKRKNIWSKNRRPFVCGLVLLAAHASEAVAAVHRTVGLGLEGNLGLAAASSAGSGEILAGAAGSSLASVTASLAALGLVLEAALSVEFLLTGGEHELLATFLTYQSLVFVHDDTLSLLLCPDPPEHPIVLGQL